MAGFKDYLFRSGVGSGIKRQNQLKLLKGAKPGWCDEFQDQFNEEWDQEIYCWIGQDSVKNWQSNPDKEWFTFDTQGWMKITDLMNMKEVTETEARQIDPDLFLLFDAINSGEAI